MVGGGDAAIIQQQGGQAQGQRGRCSRWCLPCGSLFSYYETVKYVHIEDSRLGLLRFLLLLGIVSYVVVIEMIQMGGYLESNPIVGVVRFSLQQPTINNCDPTSQRSCQNAFVPLNELLYCKQHRQYKQRARRPIQSNATTTNYVSRKSSSLDNDNNQYDDSEKENRLVYNTDYYSTASSYRGKVLPCQIYEAVNAQIIRETSIVVWTRATTNNQTLVCDGTGTMVCPRTYENNNIHSNRNRNGNSNNIVNINSNEYDIDDDSERKEGEEEEENEFDADTDDQPFFIAQSEAFTILLEHSVSASRICESHRHKKHHHHHQKQQQQQQKHYSCSAQASQYEGRLYSINDDLCSHEYHTNNNSYKEPTGNQLQQFSPCYIGPNRTTSKQHDFFSLDVLLQASGVLLDDCSSPVDDNINNSIHIDRNDGMTTSANNNKRRRRIDDDGDGNNPCITYRESGATLLLDVVWNDFRPFKGVQEPYYYYSPQLIGTSYKESIPYYEQYRSTRILFRGHGIKIAVLLGGNFHQFQFLKFLITLTTALGLLAVATTVVDSLMLYVMPEKDKYQQLKYEYESIPVNNSGVGNNNTSSVDGGGLRNATDHQPEQRQLDSAVEVSDNDETVHWLYGIRQRMLAPSSRHRHYRQVLPSQTTANTYTGGQTTVEMLETTTVAGAATTGVYPQQQQQQAGSVGNDVSKGMISGEKNNPVMSQSSDENLREPLLG